MGVFTFGYKYGNILINMKILMHTLTLLNFQYHINNPLGNGFSTIWDLAASVLGVVLPIGSILFVFMFVYAGINYITSTGDVQKLKASQAIMSNAVLGFVIMTAAFFILQIVKKALGVP